MRYPHAHVQRVDLAESLNSGLDSGCVLLERPNKNMAWASVRCLCGGGVEDRDQVGAVDADDRDRFVKCAVGLNRNVERELDR
jgi:hypothetical protein